VLHLLPPSWREVQRFRDPPQTLLEVLWTGSYPEIHDRGLAAGDW